MVNAATASTSVRLYQLASATGHPLLDNQQLLIDVAIPVGKNLRPME